MKKLLLFTAVAFALDWAFSPSGKPYKPNWQAIALGVAAGYTAQWAIRHV